jgi:hypothetical protein
VSSPTAASAKHSNPLDATANVCNNGWGSITAFAASIMITKPDTNHGNIRAVTDALPRAVRSGLCGAEIQHGNQEQHSRQFGHAAGRHGALPTTASAAAITCATFSEPFPALFHKSTQNCEVVLRVPCLQSRTEDRFDRSRESEVNVAILT